MTGAKKRIKARLEKERVHLQDDLVTLSGEIRVEHLEVGGDNTPLSEAMDQTQVGLSREARAERLGRLLLRLAAVERALKRLERGEYGKCVKCGRSIPSKRRTSLPEASLCIMCQEEVEASQRHEGWFRPTTGTHNRRAA